MTRGVTGREDEVVATFVAMAGRLVGGADVPALLSELTGACAHLLDVSAAGLLLADPKGALHVVAGSSERAADLEAFQAQREEGPCYECYRLGRAVHVPDVAAERARWPQFVAAALATGVVSVHAVPMRLRGDLLGALGLFGDEVGALNEPDLRLAQALADVATIALIQEKAAEDTSLVTEQLQHALDSRVVLEQAKGVLSYSGDIDMVEAFGALTAFSRDHNYKMAEVARRLVSRELPAEVVLGHGGGAVPRDS